MAKATWRGATLAESSDCKTVEGNLYFPLDSINHDYFVDSPTTSVCGWKGLASYYSVKVDGETNKDAAWIYREPKDAAKQIANHVAFWKGVEVQS